MQRALRSEKGGKRGRESVIENADIGIMCSGIYAADNWVNEEGWREILGGWLVLSAEA